MSVHIAIDPGAHGAIAFLDEDKRVGVYKMPETMRDLGELLEDLRAGGKGFAWVENVGGYMPGNSGPAAVKFAFHCGTVQMGVTMAGYAWDKRTPSQWMKVFLGTVPKDKAERKRAIKETAQRRYPDIKVTLDNADALGMLWVMCEGLLS